MIQYKRTSKHAPITHVTLATEGEKGMATSGLVLVGSDFMS